MDPEKFQQPTFTESHQKEAETESRDDLSAYLARVQELGLAKEIRPGMSISTEDFSPDEESDQEYAELVIDLSRFLATPTVIDEFEAHDPGAAGRVDALNSSGIFNDFNPDLSFENRLRLNKVASVTASLRALASANRRGRKILPESLNDIVQNAMSEMESRNLTSYTKLTNKERLEIVEWLEQVCIAVLNTAVETNFIKGPKL